MGVLVLSRTSDQEIILRHATTGELIRVIVVSMTENKVRLGFECGKQWDVIRPDAVGGDLDQWESRTSKPLRKQVGSNK